MQKLQRLKIITLAKMQKVYKWENSYSILDNFYFTYNYTLNISVIKKLIHLLYTLFPTFLFTIIFFNWLYFSLLSILSILLLIKWFISSWLGEFLFKNNMKIIDMLCEKKSKKNRVLANLKKTLK